MEPFKTQNGVELKLISIKGQLYLPVQQRVIGFVNDKPNWSIETELVQASDVSATAKATIRDETGRIRSTGHKHETKSDFHDFREKAETGAIGRALALIGFGTQFATDLTEGHRVVDAPVENQNGDEEAAIDPDPHGPYRVPFGKFKGKTLKEIPLNDLLMSVDYWERRAKEQKVPLDGSPKEFVDRVKAFLRKE